MGILQKMRLIIGLYLIVSLSVYGVMSDDSEEYGIMHQTSEEIIEEEKIFDSLPVLMTVDSDLSPQDLNLLEYLPYIPKERYQGSCGDCWAWASTGIVEIDHSVKENTKDRLSIQYLNSLYNDGGTTGDFACDGGNAFTFSEFYLGKESGKKVIPWSNTNASFFDANGGQPGGYYGQKTNMPAEYIDKEPSYQISDMSSYQINSSLSQKEMINTIKTVLNNKHGLYYSLRLPNGESWTEFNNFWANEPNTSLFNPDKYDGIDYTDGGGHALLMVGYNDTDKNPDNHYWLILNSWGITPQRPDGTFRIPMYINYQSKHGRVIVPINRFFTIDTTFVKPTLKINTSPADLVSSNIARLNGNIDTFGTGATRGVFWFEYGTQSGEYNKTSEMEIVGVKKFNFDLTGLEPDTKYYFRAGVTNNLKETAYGNELFFTTDPTPIEVSVKTDKADSITSSNATLFGTVNKFGITDNNGTVWFDYGKEDNNLANNTTPEFLVGSKPFNSTLAGLDVNTSYYFQAVAMNDLGQIATGDVLPFTTGKYSVETNADEFSSIYPLGPVYGDTGETLTFNITPKAGAYLTDVLDNGTSVKGQMVNDSYSITLKSNHNLTSISKLNPETLFVNFSASNTTVGVLEEVHFYDDTNGYPTQWSWDFGDGGYSTVKDPSYKYTKSGNYSVTLWARGVSGAGQSIKSDYITVT